MKKYEDMSVETLEKENTILGRQIDSIREERRYLTRILDQKLTAQRTAERLRAAGIDPDKVDVVVRPETVKGAGTAKN